MGLGDFMCRSRRVKACEIGIRSARVRGMARASNGVKRVSVWQAKRARNRWRQDVSTEAPNFDALPRHVDALEVSRLRKGDPLDRAGGGRLHDRRRRY
jgi:hypothetical protein